MEFKSTLLSNPVFSNPRLKTFYYDGVYLLVLIEMPKDGR